MKNITDYFKSPPKPDDEEEKPKKRKSTINDFFQIKQKEDIVLLDDDDERHEPAPKPVRKSLTEAKKILNKSGERVSKKVKSTEKLNQDDVLILPKKLLKVKAPTPRKKKKVLNIFSNLEKHSGQVKENSADICRNRLVKKFTTSENIVEDNQIVVEVIKSNKIPEKTNVPTSKKNEEGNENKPKESKTMSQRKQRHQKESTQSTSEKSHDKAHSKKSEVRDILVHAKKKLKLNDLDNSSTPKERKKERASRDMVEIVNEKKMMSLKIKTKQDESEANKQSASIFQAKKTKDEKIAKKETSPKMTKKANDGIVIVDSEDYIEIKLSKKTQTDSKDKHESKSDQKASNKRKSKGESNEPPAKKPCYRKWLEQPFDEDSDDSEKDFQVIKAKKSKKQVIIRSSDTTTDDSEIDDNVNVITCHSITEYFTRVQSASAEDQKGKTSKKHKKKPDVIEVEKVVSTPTSNKVHKKNASGGSRKSLGTKPQVIDLEEENTKTPISKKVHHMRATGGSRKSLVTKTQVIDLEGDSTPMLASKKVRKSVGGDKELKSTKKEGKIHLDLEENSTSTPISKKVRTSVNGDNHFMISEKNQGKVNLEPMEMERRHTRSKSKVPVPNVQDEGSCDSSVSIYKSSISPNNSRSGSLKIVFTRLKSRQVVIANKALQKAKQHKYKKTDKENRVLNKMAPKIISSNHSGLRSRKRNQSNGVEIISKDESDGVTQKKGFKMAAVNAGAKLAPLFERPKKKKKIVLDEATLLARREFLYSIPEDILKMKEARNKLESIIVNAPPFPEVNHVTQGCDISDLTQIPPTCVFKEETTLEIPKMNFPILLNHIDVQSTSSPSTLTYVRGGTLNRNVLKHALLHTKEQNPGFPVYNTFKRYAEKKKHSENIAAGKSNEMKEKNKKRRLRSKAVTETVIPSKSLWTDKYKPQKSSDIIGHQSQPIKGLKDWLMQWKEKAKAGKVNVEKRKKSKKQEENDWESNSEYDSEDGSITNAVLLLGPSGIGKTSSVYAIAKELEYKVLEVNASSNRTGRKVLSQLHEATQSHQVNTTSTETGGIQKLFRHQKATKKKTQTKKTVLDGKEEKITMVLFEDIDVVFEEYDDYFLSAISSFLADARRPIVMTTSDPNFKPGKKLRGSYDMLYFHPPPIKLTVPSLECMLLAEGVIPNQDTVLDVLNANKGDVRKSILELQYWTLSGGGVRNQLEMIPIVNEELSDWSADGHICDVKTEDMYTDAHCVESLYGMSEVHDFYTDHKIVEDLKFHGVDMWPCKKTAIKRNLVYPLPIQTKIVANNPFLDTSLYDAELSNTENDETTEVTTMCEVSNPTETVEPLDTKSRVKCDHKLLKSMADFVDTNSTLDLFVQNEQTKNWWNIQPKDSLSLLELIEDAKPLSNGLSAGILSSCISIALRSAQETSRDLILNNDIDDEYMNKISDASIATTEKLPGIYHLNHRASTLDYLPHMRSICRSEEHRLVMDGRRRSARFLHYLRDERFNLDQDVVYSLCNGFQ